MEWTFYLLTIFTLVGRTSSISDRAFRDLNKKVNRLKTYFQQEIEDLKFEVLDLSAELHLEKAKTARLEELLNATGAIPEIGPDASLPTGVPYGNDAYNVKKLTEDVDKLRKEASELSQVKESLKNCEKDIRENKVNIERVEEFTKNVSDVMRNEILKEEHAVESSKTAVAVIHSAFQEVKENVREFESHVTKRIAKESETSAVMKAGIETLKKDMAVVIEAAKKRDDDIVDIHRDIEGINERANESVEEMANIQSDLQLTSEETKNNTKHLEYALDMLKEHESTIAQHTSALNRTRDQTEDVTTTEPEMGEKASQMECRRVIRAGGKGMAELLYEGVTVKRGKDWKWDNQDGGGHGEVVTVSVTRLTSEWVTVIWDNNHQNGYRMGVSGAYDLMIVEDKFDFSRC